MSARRDNAGRNAVLKRKPDRQFDDPYLTGREVADFLGVSYRTVGNMAADGRLRAYRIGRTIRYKLSEVEAALEPVPPGAAAS